MEWTDIAITVPQKDAETAESRTYKISANSACSAVITPACSAVIRVTRFPVDWGFRTP